VDRLVGLGRGEFLGEEKLVHSERIIDHRGVPSVPLLDHLLVIAKSIKKKNSPS
jgi:hypothetical protein